MPGDEKRTSGIVIRRESGLPVYRQLVDQLRYLIGAGRYPPETYLPTMQALARELGLNLNTVNRAYRQLQRDGIVRSTPGKGARVTASAAAGAGRTGPAPAATVDQADAILAAAIERALSAGLAPRLIADRVASLIAEFGGRVPPPPRVCVEGGRAWRSVALAERLSDATRREVTPYDTTSEGPCPALVVRPRYGTWCPPVDGLESRVAVLDAPVVPDRAAVRHLVDLEPGARVLAVGADEAVARWLAEVATFGTPAAVRWVAAADASAVAPLEGEIALVEAGLPGAEAAGAICVAATFPSTISGDVDRALSA